MNFCILHTKIKWEFFSQLTQNCENWNYSRWPQYFCVHFVLFYGWLCEEWQLYFDNLFHFHIKKNLLEWTYTDRDGSCIKISVQRLIRIVQIPTTIDRLMNLVGFSIFAPIFKRSIWNAVNLTSLIILAFENSPIFSIVNIELPVRRLWYSLPYQLKQILNHFKSNLFELQMNIKTQIYVFNAHWSWSRLIDM